jgi:hypothetical protein
MLSPTDHAAKVAPVCGDRKAIFLKCHPCERLCAPSVCALLSRMHENHRVSKEPRGALMDLLTVKAKQVFFDRPELNVILSIYGRKVAAGEWRDYALDALPDRALFSIYRGASEAPLYQVEKRPDNARLQGAFSVRAAGGLILRRGHELAQVLRVLEPKHVRLVSE